jgi:anthranilate phosphoribosyltransferase
MHDAVAALLARQPVDAPTWGSFWDGLAERGLERGETVALLASLATTLPDQDSLAALLRSLDERRPAVPGRLGGAAGGAAGGAVNVVGTGGGPPTFNVSTAAAFVAAAAGVPVVKTGSRAYTGAFGSIDLLEALGVPLTGSYDQTADALDRFGVAFAGPFVYPRELALLARSIVPLGMRAFGRFLNALGPLLAAVPVSAQVTGVSNRSLLPTLRALAASVDDRTIWLCTNEHGADELLGFVENAVAVNDGTEHVLTPGRVAADTGDLDDLRPVPADRLVDHFLEVVSGNGGVATETVCLNAAALAVAGQHATDWATAMAAAREAVRSGTARRLVDRLRAEPPPAPRPAAPPARDLAEAAGHG